MKIFLSVKYFKKGVCYWTQKIHILYKSATNRDVHKTEIFYNQEKTVYL